jgi:hypothetical protein
MRSRSLLVAIKAIDEWRKRPVYRAKIGNSEIAGVVVQLARMLKVGKRISFARLTDLQGTDQGRTLAKQGWRSGVVWRIEKECLYLTQT